jgi:ABC-2 type transport system permease protein
VGGGLVRASLAIAMQYRTDFLIDGATGVLRTTAAVAPIALVFSQRDSLLGWTAPEVTLVAGLYFLMQAVIAGLVEPNLGEIVESVRQGTLDFVLHNPADAQLLVSRRRVPPSHLWDLLAAVLLLGWSVASMQAPSAVDVLAAVVLLLSGLAAMYGIWLLAICTSFFFVRVDNLRFLLWSITDAGRWPLGVFAQWVQLVLVVVVPVAVITTFPALALKGQWSWSLLGAGAGVGVLFLVLSRWAWNASLAFYTSASS